MNTNTGYSKKTLGDSYVLLSGGGHKALSGFIGTLSYSSNKITYTKANDSTSYDLVTIPTVPEYDLYVGASNGTSTAAQSTNGNVHLILKKGSNYTRYKIKGYTNISVTSTSDEIKITGPDLSGYLTSQYTTGLYVGATEAKSNAQTTNGNTYIKLFDDSTRRANIKISGSTNVSVSSNSSGDITITGPDLSGYLSSISYSDIPNLYWANVRVSNQSSNATNPTFNGLTSTGTIVSKGSFSIKNGGPYGDLQFHFYATQQEDTTTPNQYHYKSTDDSLWSTLYYFSPRFRYTHQTSGDITSTITNTEYQKRSYFQFRQYSPTETTTNGSVTAYTRSNYYECYSLPVVNSNRTNSDYYDILTTKNRITIAQGGTNNISFTNNELIYYNSSNNRFESSGITKASVVTTSGSVKNPYKLKLTGASGTNTEYDGSAEKTVSLIQKSSFLSARPVSDSIVNLITDALGIQYISVQSSITTTISDANAGKAYEGVSSNSKILCYPKKGTFVNSNNSTANIGVLRLNWDFAHFNEFFISPNYQKIFYRSVQDTTANPWYQIPKLEVTYDTNNNMKGLGSASQPVYINSDGNFVSCNSYPTKSSWNYDDVYLKLTEATNYVLKAGDTMTGALIVSGDLFASINSKNTVVDVSASDNGLTSDKWLLPYYVTDKDNDSLSGLATTVYKTGSVATRILAYNKKSDGTSVSGAIQISVDKSGNVDYSISNGSAFRSAIGAGTVTSITVQGSNGISGSGTVTTSGTITLSNSGVRSTTINGNYLRVNTNGTNADLTIPFALRAAALDSAINISGADTNDYPWRRLAYTGEITNNFTDCSAILLIYQNFNNSGNYGILKIGFRSGNIANNNSSNVEKPTAEWLCNSGFPLDYIKIGFYWNTSKMYADVFIKSHATWTRTKAIILQQYNWTLYSSNEGIDGTNLENAYININGSGTAYASKALHNINSYTEVINSTNKSLVSAVLGNSSTSTTNGNYLYYNLIQYGSVVKSLQFANGTGISLSSNGSKITITNSSPNIATTLNDYYVGYNGTNKYFVRDWTYDASNPVSTMNGVARGGRCSMGVVNLKDYSNSATETQLAAVNPGGQTGWHHFINISNSDGGGGNNAHETQLANKAGTNDLWIRSRNGNTITDGVDWTANWTKILTEANSGYKFIGHPNVPTIANSTDVVYLRIARFIRSTDKGWILCQVESDDNTGPHIGKYMISWYWTPDSTFNTFTLYPKMRDVYCYYWQSLNYFPEDDKYSQTDGSKLLKIVRTDKIVDTSGTYNGVYRTFDIIFTCPRGYNITNFRILSYNSSTKFIPVTSEGSTTPYTCPLNYTPDGTNDGEKEYGCIMSPLHFGQTWHINDIILHNGAYVYDNNGTNDVNQRLWQNWTNATPALVFQRGIANDNQYDWKIYGGNDDKLYIKNCKNFSWNNVITLNSNQTVTFASTVTATNFYASSDERLKDILSNPNYKAEQFASLPLVKYKWKKIIDDSINLGTIAQDVEKDFPELVSGDEYKSLDYAVLGTIGVISLAREIVELKKEIKELKKMLYE